VPSTLLAALAALSERLAATRSRLEVLRCLGVFLGALPPEDRGFAARLLIGRPLPPGDPRKLDVSGSSVWRAVSGVVGESAAGTPAWGEAVDFGEAVAHLFAAAGWKPAGPALTIGDVADGVVALAAQSGKGARTGRERILRGLFGRATPSEARFLAKALLGDMRHGASEGVLLEAVARAVGAPGETVRRAAMLLGDPGEVVRLAFQDGAEALAALTPRPMLPVKPMLAQTTGSLQAAWEGRPGGWALEYKLDGARIQIHAAGGEVRLFSRRLHDVTGSLPEVAAAVRRALGDRRVILEGEVIAVDASGRPRPFQELLQRYRRLHDVEEALAGVPVQLFLFDLLSADGEPLFGEPYEERWRRLQRLGSQLRLVPRRVPGSLAEAEAFYGEALAAGHEGLMLKRLESPYVPGMRGGHWLKLKRVQTLDLVIIAADYGYGRRHGWLSNYHLAGRDQATGEFRPVGKTFKGLTDEEFRQMTARLLALERGREGGTVSVAPEVVVEVAYSDLQKSALYPDGMALRFARILRIRDDKPASEADTLQHMRRLFEEQWTGAGQA
jgi:DNA ligase-1